MKTSFFRLAARIGEYNTSASLDCVDGPFGQDCIDNVLEIPFEEILIHPEFSKRTYTHDIALLRLNTTVQYTGTAIVCS